MIFFYQLSRRLFASVTVYSRGSSAIAETALQNGLVLAKRDRLELGDNIFQTP